MKVKTALIRFGACFIVGIVGFYFVVPLMIETIGGFSWGYFAPPVLLMLYGFLGFIGTLVPWIFARTYELFEGHPIFRLIRWFNACARALARPLVNRWKMLTIRWERFLQNHKTFRAIWWLIVAIMFVIFSVFFTLVLEVNAHG